MTKRTAPLNPPTPVEDRKAPNRSDRMPACDAYLYNGTRCRRPVVISGDTEDGLQVHRCRQHQADVVVA